MGLLTLGSVPAFCASDIMTLMTGQGMRVVIEVSPFAYWLFFLTRMHVLMLYKCDHFYLFKSNVKLFFASESLNNCNFLL